MLTVTVEEHWSSGHRLPNHQGMCRFLHGHNYKGLFTFTTMDKTVVNMNGMIADFANLKVVIKAAVERFDHKMILQRRDPLVAVIPGEHLVLVEVAPTVENLCMIIASELKAILPRIPERTKLTEITIWETAKASATWKTQE